jgi:hypothetical protein
MSKFDVIFKRIQENLPVTPQQQNAAAKPVVQTTPQQQQAALQQFAQTMGIDAAALQKAIETLKQQQQKTNAAQTAPGTTQQPAV